MHRWTVAQGFFNKKSRLLTGKAAYKAAEARYPFLVYTPASVKPSIYSYLGNYLGFQGYYNPFSGEGQVNTTIPRFLEPFVTAHEIAHQVGYARENEANFVAYLACREYESPAFRYSLYLDMYGYALGEVYRRDTAMARRFQEKVHPQVKRPAGIPAFFLSHGIRGRSGDGIWPFSPLIISRLVKKLQWWWPGWWRIISFGEL
jgi:hypothetical protein